MSHLGRRLSALVDGELTGARRDRALTHLARCDDCREEAVTLRTLKQRMRGMSETTADDTLTLRLMALAAGQGQRPRPRWRLPGQRPERAWQGRRRRLVPSLVGAAAAAAALSLPAAAFLLGGADPSPGPKVTPAVDVFIVQHSITGDQDFVPRAGQQAGAPRSLASAAPGAIASPALAARGNARGSARAMRTTAPAPSFSAAAARRLVPRRPVLRASLP